MRKTVRKSIAILIAALMLLGAVPILANATETLNLTKPVNNRLASTVNAFAEDPYNKSSRSLWTANETIPFTTGAMNDTKYYLATGNNASTYVEAKSHTRNTNFSISAAGVFYGITVKVGYELNYKKSTSSNYQLNTSNFYYNYEVAKRLNSKTIYGASPSNLQPLREKMSATAINELKTLTPADVFKYYGTHVIMAYAAGGSFELRARATSMNSNLIVTETVDQTHKIPIEVGGIGGVVKVDATTTINDIAAISETWKDSSVDYKLDGAYRGGTGALSVGDLADPAQASALRVSVGKWENSITDANANVVVDENLVLAPIWDLLPPADAARKAELMRYYYDKAATINDDFFKDAAFYNNTADFPEVDDPAYAISTAAQLAALNGKTSGNYYLTNNIDLGSATKSAPIIATFGASLDGRGFAITNINITNTAKDANASVGLIGTLNGGDVKNLTVQGNMYGNVKGGGVAAYMKSGATIDNCTSYCNLTNVGGYASANGRGDCPRFGGIVGEIECSNNTSCKVTNCTNKGSVNYAGVVATFGGTVLPNSKNNVDGDWYSAGVGGIVGGTKMGAGSAPTYITNCVNDSAGNTAANFLRYECTSAAFGTWKGTPELKCGNAGGIVGMIDSGNVIIDNCLNLTEVNSNAATGGIVGYAFGDANNGAIKNCHNQGRIYDATRPAILGAGTALAFSGNTFKGGMATAANATSLGNTDADKKVAAIKASIPKAVARVSINPASPAISKTYYYYDSVDYGDLLLDIVYSDGSVKTGIKDGFSCIYNFDPASPKYKAAIAAKIDGCAAIQAVTVTAPVVTGAAVLEIAPQAQGQALDPNGIIIQQQMSNGNVVIVNSSSANITTNFDPNKAGVQNVTVYMDGQPVGSYQVNTAPITYTVSFSSDGAGNVPAITATKDVAIKMPAAPTKAGYIFKGWKAGDTILQAGADYTATANINFVAQWEKDSSGGTPVEPAKKYIKLWGKTTTYESTFINWLLAIVCFGWIWMIF